MPLAVGRERQRRGGGAADWGVKPVLIIAVWPGLASVRLKGGYTVKALLPEAEIVALKICTGLQPLFFTVIGSVAATPTKVLPKFSVEWHRLQGGARTRSARAAGPCTVRESPDRPYRSCRRR